MAERKKATITGAKTSQNESTTVDEMAEELEKRKNEKIPEDWKDLVDAFDEYVYEDVPDIALICKTAGNMLYDRFRINITRPEDPFFHYYKMTAMIFIYTYQAIVNYLMKKREKNASYQINIANRLSIGFTNSDCDEDEKNGNFMIFIRDIPNYVVKEDDGPKSQSHSREYIRNWNQENMIENPQDTMEIATKALKMLNNIKIRIGSAELIFPVFVTIYESALNYMKTIRREREETEFEINFCNCFFLKCVEQDDGVDKVIIRPAIEGKMALKSDKIGTSIYE